MEHRGNESGHHFYSDAMSNYIVLRCPVEAQDDYQYRMLAMNRIPGLLPCSIRVIDGESFLYYSITSRQSVARRYEQHVMDGEELRKLLFAAAYMIGALSEFLLDATRLLMDPEYIFYDYEQEEYCFTYYPGVQQEGHQTALFEYLADRIDAEDDVSRIVTLRLCELSENEGFVLKTELLEHEYALARGPQTLYGKADYTDEETCGEKDAAAKKREQSAGDRANAIPWEPEDELDDAKKEEAGKTKRRRRKGEKERRKSEEEPSPARMLIITILFAGVAAGLFAISLNVTTLTEEELFSLRAGMLFCLGLTVISAAYGIVQILRNGKRRAQKEEQDEEEKRKNAMIPTAGVL